MNDFLLHIGWLTLSMSLVILLALLFNAVFGKRFSAKSRYIVWTVVILSLCIGVGLFKLPSLFTVEISMPSFIEDNVDVPEQTPINDGIQSPISDAPSISLPTNPDTNTNPDYVSSDNTANDTAPALTQTPEKEQIHIDFTLILFIIWLTGAILYFSFGMVVYIRTIRKYDRKIKLCDKKTEGLFRSLCHRYNVKRVPNLFVCSEVGSPILYGYTEPTVLLPDINLSPNSLVGVLAHELTHYRRGDIWIKLVCLLVESLYWFDPIVHLATARCNAEMELSCDEEVLTGLNEDIRRSYGNVMLDIVEHCNRKRSLLTTQFNPHKNAVKERIMNILDMKKKKRGRAVITVALVLCIVSGTVIGCTVIDNNDGVQSLDINTLQNESDHPVEEQNTDSELYRFLDMTFDEIDSAGYTLEHLQGTNGWAGWPNYSISGYEGVTLTFRVSYGEETREHLTNMIPDGVEITTPDITINGLRVSMTGAEAKKHLTSWDNVYFSLEHGGRIYATTYKNNNGYEITAYWSMPDDMYNELLASIPADADDGAFVDAKEKLVEPFKDNPKGEIVGLRIENK